MSVTTNDYNFIRAMIKIANPTWTPEQIEAELKKKIEDIENPKNDTGCDMCSG
jgi:hypothetical protein